MGISEDNRNDKKSPGERGNKNTHKHGWKIISKVVYNEFWRAV